MAMTKRSFPKRDLTGRQFGRLRVVSFLHFHEDSKGRRHAMWNVTCSCGTIKRIRGSQLSSGGTISCGCALKEEYVKMKNKAAIRNTKPAGVHAFNFLLNSYRQRAKREAISFTISESEFKQLTSSNCHFCGTLPLKISPVPALRKRSKVNGYYMYNGIDRIDSNMGYDLTNCVTCCETCNKAKRDLTLAEFYLWINRLMKFQGQQLSSNLLEQQMTQNS